MAALCSVTHGLIVGNIGRYSQVNSLSELAIFTPLMTKPEQILSSPGSRQADCASAAPPGWSATNVRLSREQPPPSSDGARGRSTLDHMIAAFAVHFRIFILVFSVELLGGEWLCATYCRRPPARLRARPPAGRAAARPHPRKHDGRSPAVSRPLPAVRSAFDAVWSLPLFLWSHK